MLEEKQRQVYKMAACSADVCKVWLWGWLLVRDIVDWREGISGVQLKISTQSHTVQKEDRDGSATGLSFLKLAKDK
jgi:hypothetical protein